MRGPCGGSYGWENEKTKSLSEFVVRNIAVCAECRVPLVITDTAQESLYLHQQKETRYYINNIQN